jgi:small subunit ribosomal protein S19
MARKEFTYRGHTLEELQKLSRDELKRVFTSRIRRTLERGYPEETKKAEAKILANDNVKTHCREIIILPKMVGKIVNVYNGQEFKEVRIEAEMIGHVLGEFSLTRKMVKHNKAGVGATGGSSAVSIR